MNKKRRGFTLIEVLVVIVIIGITASFAVLSLSSYFGSRQIKAVVDDLSVKIPAAQRQAIILPAVTGLLIQPHSYAFYQFSQQSEQWQLITNDELLAPKNLPAGLTLSVQAQNLFNSGEKNKLQPQIVFSSTGDQTPFKLSIQEGKNKTIIVGDGSGNIMVTNEK